jgi:hypothetical protein
MTEVPKKEEPKKEETKKEVDIWADLPCAPVFSAETQAKWKADSLAYHSSLKSLVDATRMPIEPVHGFRLRPPRGRGRGRVRGRGRGYTASVGSGSLADSESSSVASKN